MVPGARFLRLDWRVLALATAAACADKAPLPAQLPDCDSGTMCGSTGGHGSGTGTGGSSGDSGAASCGQIAFRDRTCNTCVQTNCCDRNQKCSANMECLAIFDCVAVCAPSDQACRDTCQDRHQNGVAEYQNFTGCIKMACDTACSGTDAGSTCGSLDFGSTACNTCMDANCCTESAACANDSDCFALLQCVAACPATDQQCGTDCIAQHPNGSAAYNALTQCRAASCTTQCR
jgi:hypothetical protein